ncbi:hypothetical protein [Streptomyces sp. NPDC051162]|uniref:hypothetical protein n=1 Tax=Streptomyces sp. NPDC051162 TaxID=3154747 RepID=UPI003417120E
MGGPAEARTRTDLRPLTPSIHKYAADQVKRAASFLEWLADHDQTLATVIDLWHVEHNQHDRNTIRPFLMWRQTTKLTRRFRLSSPPTRRAGGPTLPERAR